MDGAGRAYIAGNEERVLAPQAYTFQSCFPTTSGAVIGGTQPVGGDPQYAFVAVFDPTGAHLLYSTLFGDLNFKCIIGCGGDTYGTGVAVDANGYFYLAGETKAGNLPTTAGVIQPTGAPLEQPLELFANLARLRRQVQSGHFRRWSIAGLLPPTLAGKPGIPGDYISGIAIDSASNAYVVGYTNSTDFPVTSGAYGTVCGPNGQTCAAAHVTKLNPHRHRHPLVHLCGRRQGRWQRRVFFTGPIQLDGNGNVYIMGQAGPGFPLVNPVEPAGNGGAMQVLVAELDPTGANLLFSTYIGSGRAATPSSPAGLAVDSAGNIYLAGNIRRPGPDHHSRRIPDDRQSNNPCCYHGFVAKIAATTRPGISRPPACSMPLRSRRAGLPPTSSSP